MCIYCEARVNRALPLGDERRDVSQFSSGRHVIDLGARAVHALHERGAHLIFGVSSEELSQQLPCIYVRDSDRNALLRVAAGHADCIDLVHVGEEHVDSIPAAMEIFPRARIVGLCRLRETRRSLLELRIPFEHLEGSYVIHGNTSR